MRLFLFLFPLVLLGQSLPTLTYDQTQNIEYFKQIKNRTPFISYTSKNGATLTIGDSLVLAYPSTRSSMGYARTSRNQNALIESKEQKRFEFVQFGKRLILRNNQFFTNQSPDAYPTNRLSGERVIIKEIVGIHKGSRKKPLAVYLVLGEQNNRSFGIYKYLTVADVENALNYGEITLINPPLTKEGALKKLKEAKDFLELELISQEEYDKIKMDMTPIIKQ